MTLSIKNIFLGLLALILGSYALYAITGKAYAAITVDNATPVNLYRTYDFFASTTAATGTVSATVLATTTTATSTNIVAFMDSTLGRYVDGSFEIAGAKKVTLYFGRGGATSPNTGASQFNVQATRDGSTWFDVNRLLGVDVSATATSTVNITAATSTFVAALDIKDQAFKAVRCIVVETTDGEHTCAASASF